MNTLNEELNSFSSLLFTQETFKRLNSKNVSDVVDPLPPALLLRHVEGPSDEVLLLVLDLQHLALDGVRGDELVDEDLLSLAEPVDPVEALPLAGRVPGGVQQEEVVGSGEVQSDSTGLKGEKSVKSEEI